MSIMTIKLSRSEGTPWGFRLQGGKDFATPLCIQKVNAGSVAAVAGLQAGDTIVSIGSKDAFTLRHKEAQEAIVRAGNNFDLVIQRGAQTWRPQVTPLAQVKTTPEGVPVATSTSLAANKKPVRHIGSNHNMVARPFPGFTGATPTYTSGSSIIRSPLSNSSEEVAGSSLSGTSSRSTSGSTSPSGFQQAASPTISLNKEIAKNFLRMTLDKENVNTMNVHQTPRGGSSSGPKSSSSSENLFSGAFSSASGPGHQRKYSLASNASSSSSEADHDTLTRRNNEVNGQQIVNAQYNSPLNLYSEDNIAETLSAQAEVLGKGCLGVNFMKNERAYDGKTSDVLRMVQEMDSNPVPEPEESPAGSAGPGPTGHRSVRAPETKVRAPGEPSPSQATKCSECERPITGVFVRIKNKSLHADCFKCATCGSSLKNVGYYNINEKLYCDVHAKQAARHHPPAPNMDPIIVKPGTTPPSGAITASMAKTAAPFKPPAGSIRIMPSAPAPAPASMPKFSPIPPPKPAPILAPAPAPIQVPAAPMAAPPPTFSPVKAPAAPAPQKAPFGAPAGGVDVRSHIPKKGGPFLWPPPKKVESGEEGPRTPSWAPAGEPVNVPKPKYIAGPPPKRPPLLPTPPPPKDYDSIVIKASPSATAQPSADPKAHPLAFASASAPAPAPAPVPAPACKLPASPEASKAPQPTVNASTPAAKPAITKPVSNKPAASKPIPGFKPVAAPKAGPKAPSYGYKPVSSPSQKNGPAPGAPSLLASTPIPPPAPVPIVNSDPAPAPKPPAAAFASVPKPAAPKPPAPTGPAPAFAPAPAPELPKPSPLPNLGGAPMKGVAQTSGQKPAPRRGRGVMNPSNAARIPICADCTRQIRGPFVSALGKTWCPDHFVCSTASCRKALIDMGFVEEQGALHCEDCYEKYLAPICGKCDKRVKGDCLNAVGKQFHPECFCCAYCGKVFGSGAFYLEDGLPYCEADWNDLFTTKCVGCGFPIEAGDRWVEALNNNYHSQCFKCSKCHKNLEGQSFFAKGGKPFCKAHAQRGL